MDNLIGVGLYTPIEASRLTGVSARKIRRWLGGYSRRGKRYEPLWTPEIEAIEGQPYLGFRDLLEVRVANRFIEEGFSPQRMRAAIAIARDVVGQDHPLSTNRFKTDGRSIFLELVEKDEQGQNRKHLLNLVKQQYAFEKLLKPLLVDIEFDDEGAPRRWWPRGKAVRVLIDPARAFGQPIEVESSVPTSVLAAAGEVEGVEGAARLYEVSRDAVRRAIKFEAEVERLAA